MSHRPPSVSAAVHERAPWEVRWAPWLILLVGAWVYSNSFAGPLVLDDLPWIRDNPHLQHLWPIWQTMARPPKTDVAARPGRWYVCAWVCCACGMLTKPVMLTAPLVVACYDWMFGARSLRQMMSKRGWFYLALASTWFILWVLWATTTAHSLSSAGFALRGVTPLAYARTQPAALLHYVRLAVWPYPLVFDYWWPLAESWRAVAMPLAFIGMLLGVTVWLVARRHPLGWLGAWCWLTLAPTSSVFPIKDVIAEHRMYLPLAAVLALLVIGVDRLLQRWVATPTFRRKLGMGLAVVSVWGLGGLTLQRNATYQSAPRLWMDTLAKRPSNPRAWASLGMLHEDAGQLAEAECSYRRAVSLSADYDEAWNNLGVVLVRLGRAREAVPAYQRALALRPSYALTHYNLASAYAAFSQHQQAINEYATALSLRPNFAEAQNALGNSLAALGRVSEAEARYRQALALNPEYAEAHNSLGVLLAQQGRVAEGLEHMRQAVRIRPDYDEARHNLAALQQPQS